MSNSISQSIRHASKIRLVEDPQKASIKLLACKNFAQTQCPDFVCEFASPITFSTSEFSPTHDVLI
jgi:hypothetical protein